MGIRTVGILSPGEMGSAVGRVLRDGGLDVVTCLEGRSAGSRARAQSAGVRDVPTDGELVSACDLLLSILVPAQAAQVALEVADALRSEGARAEDATLVYADCNAVAPQTVRRIAETITGAGARFVDAGVIGGPPARGRSPQIYASGPASAVLAELSGCGLDIRPMEGPVGRASGLKMCYAALTKGSTALWTEILVAAQALGLSEELGHLFASSQGATYSRMEPSIRTMLSKSGRYVGEMEEIAATFEHLGLTPRILLGAADSYRSIAATPLAEEDGAAQAQGGSLAELVAALTGSMGLAQG